MLVAYLDDSGTDDSSPIITIAGYVARDDAWTAFETDVAPILAGYGVEVLHAKDFHDTHGSFKAWSSLRKSNFVTELCTKVQQHLILGISISARKRSYTGRKAETRLAQSTSLYAYCFNILLHKLLRTAEAAPHIHAGGLAFVLEAGNRNDDDVSRLFYEIRSLHGLEDRLNFVTFAEKQRGPSIQIADFLAFYSRRHAVECETHQEPVPTHGILDQIVRSVPHYGLVVTDFYP